MENNMNILKVFSIFTCLSVSCVAYTGDLTIAIKEPVPQKVPAFGEVSAFYTITNTTASPLSNVFVKKLPQNVTQVTCDPHYCGTSFTLDAQGSPNNSCILKLSVKGPVHATPLDLLVCTSSSCYGTDSPLDISTGPSEPFINISSGSYSNNHSGIFPLLASSSDSGANWAYPPSIFKDLKTAIDPAFENGVLSSASCNRSYDKNRCVAAGQWCSGPFCDSPLPLIAVGLEKASQWFYPKTVFENLQSRVDPNFLGGSLRSSACFGSGGTTNCIAGGNYFTSSTRFPLLARSFDGGSNWNYPPSIYQNLTTAISPDFKSGSLFSTSCTQSTCDTVCIASGNFCTTTNCDFQLPLLALSTDKGATWSYPAAIFQDLPTKLEPTFNNGYLVSSSCTGTGKTARCSAVGTFNTPTQLLPLLALTTDGGTTWTYPPAIFKDLETVIGHSFNGASFNATSCSGSEKKAVCIAAGSYFRKSGTGIPMLSITKNGGATWTYPDFIYTKLKTLVDPDFVGGTFDGASCIDGGKSGLCVAAGNYCRKDGKCFPLIALTTNGGKTWSYPRSVYSDLFTIIDPNFRFGFFNDISCQGKAEHNFCVASGQYSNTSGDTFPLVAYSSDSGSTWTYPPSIYKDLTTIIDPDLAIASFVKTSTSGGA